MGLPPCARRFRRRPGTWRVHAACPSPQSTDPSLAARYMSDVRKSIRPCGIELHPKDCAIIVHYDVESSIDGERIGVESKTTRVLMKTLRSDSNVSRLAEDVVRKCKYIAPHDQMLVEQLIMQLQQRLATQDAKVGNTPAAGLEGLIDGRINREDGLPAAHIGELDDYLELLYEGQEEMTEKIHGTAMILKLCRNVGHLEQLIQNHTVMGALSRVLAEEFRKSMDLTYNIVRIFLSFSNFQEMHAILANYRVGNMMMKILDLEAKRIEHRNEEDRKREEDGESLRKADGGRESERLAKRRARDAAKFRILQQKQDRLLFAVFHVLINLAEDANVEKKMVKRGVIDFLLLLLQRSSANLLIIVTAFLKKLSVFEENVAQIVQGGAVAGLVRALPCSNDPLMHVTLRCLFNLSFDAAARTAMMEASLLPKLAELLKKAPFRARTLRLLYHLSADDRCKSLFTYTDAVPIVMKLLLNFPQPQVPGELGALAVNLSINARNAEIMSSGRGLSQLVDRMCQTKDKLLAKVVRNVALWTFNLQADAKDPGREYRQGQVWAPHVRSLLSLCTQPDVATDLVLEVIGTLACITVFDLPRNASWGDMIEEFQLTSFFVKLLVPGMSETDLALEVVLFIDQLAMDPESAPVMANSQVMRCLFELLRDKGNDAEVVLQLLLTFRRLCVHTATREEILYSKRAVVDIMDHLDHDHPRVRMAADECLRMLLDHARDNEMSGEIRRRRFESYNRQWLEAMRGDGPATDYGEGMKMSEDCQGRVDMHRRQYFPGDGKHEGSEIDEGYSKSYGAARRKEDRATLDVGDVGDALGSSYAGGYKEWE